MIKHMERVGGSIAAVSAAATLVSGCGQEVNGTASKGEVVTEVIYVTPEQNDGGVTTAQEVPSTSVSPSEVKSILDDKPSDVNSVYWCGFVAARAATKYVMAEAGAPDAPGFHSPKTQEFVKIGKTSIGYAFDIETQVGHPGQISVRGSWAIASDAPTPLEALDTVSVREDFTPEMVAVWNHAKGNLGGTTNNGDPAICEAAQDVVDIAGQ